MNMGIVMESAWSISWCTQWLLMLLLWDVRIFSICFVGHVIIAHRCLFFSHGLTSSLLRRRMINSTFNWGNQDLLGRVSLVHHRNELMLVLFPLPPQDFSCNTGHHLLMSCYPFGDPECLHKPPASPPDQNRCVTMTNNTIYLMLEHPTFNGCKVTFHAPTSTAGIFASDSSFKCLLRASS